MVWRTGEIDGPRWTAGLRALIAHVLALCVPAAAEEAAIRLEVPPGFTIEQVRVEPPLEFPMFAAWDDRGGLYVAESSGLDLYAELAAQTRKCRIRRLEDRDGDGHFERGTVFADRLVFPMGLAWHDGALYVPDPPDVVTFRDTDDNGMADERRVILTGFGHTDNGSLHGLVFGPDARLYMTMGHPDGYRLKRDDGSILAGTNGALLRCRADGSQPQVVCRGFTNLVELVFLPGGAMIGTDNFYQTPSGGLRDALVHLVEGGLYPQNTYEDETFHVVTGELLPPVTRLPTTGISGLARYRGTAFPEPYRENLFSAQHNTRKVQRHILVPQDATWTANDEDFVTTDHPDFHPSDVLEDADGSLLVVDTGGWYVQHCPTGRIQHSRAPGGLYRVRYAAADPVEDPWGTAVDWTAANEKTLLNLLCEPRVAVRDRAENELARRGVAGLSAVGNWLPACDDSDAQRRALWLLARSSHSEGSRALRSALDDEDALSVQVAARGLALCADRGAEQKLRGLLSSPQAGVRLAAAEALGPCGSRQSLDAIWSALAESADPFLRHALVLAASRHTTQADLFAALGSRSPRVEQAALLLLDQPPHEALGYEAVVARLGSDDPHVRQTALSVLQRHSEWADRAVTLIAGWLNQPAFDDERRAGLRTLALAFHQRPEVAELASSAIAGRTQAIPATRILLLETLRDSPSAELHPAWREAIGLALADGDPAIRHAAARTAAALDLRDFAPVLAALADDETTDIGLRLDLLRSATRARAQLSGRAIDWLIERVADAEKPIDQLSAAEVLIHCELGDRQLVALLESATPQLLVSPSLLMPLLERSIDDRTAEAIAEFLSARLESGWRPSERDLAGLLAQFPPAQRESAQRLLATLRRQVENQQHELAEFLPLLDERGEVERGREVFFGNVAACSACHRVGDEGGQVGPDLTRIGTVRSGRDLVESIVVPSSTFAQGFESYTVQTVDGLVFTGILGRQTPEVVVLVDSARNEVRITREQIELMERSSTSIMPDGFASKLSREQLRDLMAWLRSLK